jgi:ATP-binding cassette, subfamily B, bacterial PglK
MTFFRHVLRLISFYDSSLKRTLFIGAAFLTCMSFLEIVGVGLIFPVIQLLNTENLSESNDLLYDFSVMVGITDSVHLAILSVVFIVIILSMKAILSVWINYFISKSCFNGRERFGLNLFNAMLSAPLEWHHDNNTGETLHHLNVTVSAIFMTSVLSISQLISQLSLAVGMISILIYASPIVAFFSLIFGIIILFIMSITLSKPIDYFALKLHQGHMKMNSHLLQSFAGIQEVRTLARESFFSKGYGDLLKKFAKPTYSLQVLGILPQYIFEVMASLFVLLVLIFLFQTHARHEILPILALYAVAALRLLPTVGRITTTMNGLRNTIPAANEVEKLINEFGVWIIGKSRNMVNFKPVARVVTLQDEIKLNHIGFSYNNTNSKVIKDISLSIKRGEAIGIAGPSGAGKSTLINIFLGLYKPSQGEIFVDGVELDQSLSAYQRSIGFVPQSVFLIDSTIRENVAFGLPQDEIDDAHVKEALEAAQLWSFVESQPNGLETIVGENGVKMSGGQRQRLGIARALYEKPDILVLDEATSSLDLETEAEITKVMMKLHGKTTLIIIAHRLSTIKNCDRIYFLKEGQVVGAGPFDELRKSNKDFARLVELGNLDAT